MVYGMTAKSNPNVYRDANGMLTFNMGGGPTTPGVIGPSPSYGSQPRKKAG
jgi:hypothetical protein